MPELPPELSLYWVAYGHLSTCRPAGFGGGYPVPWTAVVAYAEVNGFDEEQLDRLVYFVGELDTAFLKWYGAKHDRSGGETKPTGPWSGKGS